MKSMSRDSPNKAAGRTGCLARLGRLGEAQGEVQGRPSPRPGFRRQAHRAQAESDNPAYLAQRERVAEGTNGGRARGGQENKLIGIAGALFARNGMTVLTRTPVLPEATHVGALSALLRQSLYAQRWSARDFLLTFKIGSMNELEARESGLWQSVARSVLRIYSWEL